MAITITDVADYSTLKGKELEFSDWHLVTQEDVSQFADTTRDWAWIHVDAERASKGPFGGTIAHGLFTLSLLPYLMRQVISYEGTGTGLNYGFNKVRFIAPVPVGSHIRLKLAIEDVVQLDGGVEVVMAAVIECDEAERPVCVATWLARYYG